MKKYSFLLVLLAAMALSACKKDDSLDGTGNFKIEFEHNWGTTEMEPGNLIYYTTANGDSVQINTLKYYVSNIILTNSNGSTYTVPNSYFLVDAANPASTLIDISNVPAGDYTSASFIIGVDSARTATGPYTGALDQTNGMYFGNSDGYIFFNLEGASPNSPNDTIRYYVGGCTGSNNALQTVTIDFNGSKAEVRKGEASQVHISVDAATVFNSTPTVAVSNTFFIISPSADGVTMSNRYKNMFEFEHIHN